LISIANAQEVVAQATAQNVEQMNFIQKAFHDGGWTMYIIAIVGVLTVLIIVERFMTLSRLSVDKDDFMDKILGLVLRGDLRGAITFCDSKQVPLTNTLKAGLIQAANKRPDEEIQVAMDGASLKELPRLEGWTPFLAVFGNVATLIGLLGTIVGLITSFGAVSNADPGKKAELLSNGIAEALNNTAFGLLIAIPAIIFYGYFQLRIGRATNELAEGSMNLMNTVVSNRDKMKY
jgi:biopolymer transport protein ExbB/TolQ